VSDSTRAQTSASADSRLSFEIGGCLTLDIVEPDERVEAFVRSQLNPCTPSAGTRTPDVVLETLDAQRPHGFADVQNPAGDGIVTASDGVGFYVVDGELACRLPSSLREEPAWFAADRGFPLWRIFGALVRPTLQIRALDHDAAVVHGASTVVDGAGVVVAGWSETGKTETALALMERGATFLSDKWTVVSPDGTIALFPISVGVRRWVLRYLPQLRSSLPAAARGQFVLAGLISTAARPLRRIPARGRVAGLAQTALERATMMVDRAALSPAQVRQAYGQDPEGDWSAPLRIVAHLTTVSEARVEVNPADAGWAARRLARSAAFERRAAFELYERRRYAFPDSESASVEEVVGREETVLERAFGDALVLDVRAPFPTDPRPVAEAISRFL
jgi:hypothetical protein